MHWNRYKSHLIQAQHDVRYWRLVVIALLTINVCLAVALVSARQKAITTVVVPATLQKPISIEGGKVDRQYLEQWGLFLAKALVDVTPETAAALRATVIEYTHPANRGQVNDHLLFATGRLERSNASQTLLPARIEVDQPTNTVRVTGTVVTWVGRTETSRKTKTFTLTLAFEESTGKLLITSFKEEDSDDQ